jgi:hypothetical protein
MNSAINFSVDGLASDQQHYLSPLTLASAILDLILHLRMSKSNPYPNFWLFQTQVVI